VLFLSIASEAFGVSHSISLRLLAVLAIEGTEMVGDLTTLICGGGSTLPPSFSELKSDCAGSFPNVQCSCCTECL
jgi:hypothetical protein